MKKTLLKLLGATVLLACLFTACPAAPEVKPDPNAGLGKAPGTVGEFAPSLIAASKVLDQVRKSKDDVVFFYYRPDGKYTGWDLYTWITDGDSAGSFQEITSDGMKLGYVNLSQADVLPEGVPEALANQDKINFIVRNGGNDWKGKDPDGDRTFDTSKCKCYLSISGDSSVYFVMDDLSPSLAAANMESKTEMKLVLSNEFALEGSASDNGFVLKATDGTEIPISDVKNYAYKSEDDRSKNFSSTLYVKLADDMDYSKEWYISHPKFVPSSGIKVSFANASKDSIMEIVYEGNDLGLTLNGTKASFKTWAPLASSVDLLLFTDAANLETPAAVKPMTKGSKGEWSIADVDVTGYKYYKFRITNGGVTNDVCDIYAKAASPDSVAAQIVDINADDSAKPTGWVDTYVNPYGSNGTVAKRYTDAVIYEMHIRDWSRLEVADSTGKFIDIAEGTKVIEHIKNLGITHVQILPAFDYAQKNSDNGYNWGYNPYHYNVPEGRYVKDMVDGTDAVKQFRQLIKAFHDAGIAVNMDVVYNHTAGTGAGSLYDMTVPYYYYRLNPDGTYANGSGCGNETDSEAPMYRKYMIESLVHWMKDYHINGFRFDLMGLHDAETMKQVYKALCEVDPNVMVYGEPWQGGSYAGKGKPADKANINLCAESDDVDGVAFFNDEIRNGIKGSEYPGFNKGQVSTVNCFESISQHMGGKKYSKRIGRSINYVECHDNLTIADKLALVMNGKTSPTDGNWVGCSTEPAVGAILQGGREELKKRDELAAAYMFLAQGTVFINGGQEFLRSKKGDENSYISKDNINEIKQGYIDDYEDVTAYYKGLIALRKAYPETFGHNEDVKFEKLSSGLVNKYTTGDFVVYFNADTKVAVLSDVCTGKVVTIKNGTVDIAAEATTTAVIPALSCVIIKVR